jgi:hypothetical protein
MFQGGRPVRRFGLIVMVALLSLTMVFPLPHRAMAQSPWETSQGRACFERWIAEASGRLIAYNGDRDFNARKPWGFNQYGLLVGRGISSNYPSDNWGQVGGNRYWWMWENRDYVYGFGSRWPVWGIVGVPPLRDYVLRCIGTGAGPRPPQPVPGMAGVQMENNVNRPGGDYRSFDLAQAIPQLCRDACFGDSRCRAYTYVRPGIQGPSARCWLKSTVPNPQPNTCCVSGVR